MENYFNGCKTEKDYTERYRTLAKKWHPDQGGTEAKMKEVNVEWDKIKKNNFKKPDDKAQWDDRNFHTSAGRAWGKRSAAQDFAEKMEEARRWANAQNEAFKKAESKGRRKAKPFWDGSGGGFDFDGFDGFNDDDEDIASKMEREKKAAKEKVKANRKNNAWKSFREDLRNTTIADLEQVLKDLWNFKYDKEHE